MWSEHVLLKYLFLWSPWILLLSVKKVIYSRKRLMNRKGERMLSDLLSRALKTSMTMHSFIISTNLLAALETHFDLWEDLLNLAALQQAIKIVAPYNKVVQITQSEHLAPSSSRKMPPSSLQSRREYSSLAREGSAMYNGFCSRGSLSTSVCAGWLCIYRPECLSSWWEENVDRCPQPALVGQVAVFVGDECCSGSLAQGAGCRWKPWWLCTEARGRGIPRSWPDPHCCPAPVSLCSLCPPLVA